MINIDTIKTDSKHNLDFFKESLQNVSSVLYSKQPGEGQWSIQQILEHLTVTEKGVLMMGNGPTTDTDRDPSVTIHQVRDALGDRTSKRVAPAQVSPPGEDKTMEEFIAILESTRQSFIDQANSKGWNQILTLFPHPIAGTMTRLEWLYFHIYHTERHLQQIKEIIQNPKLNDA